MATLVSPGVSVSIIEESIAVGAGQGTVPFVMIATAQDKTTPDGTAIAAGTTMANAGKLHLITSQRELIQQFGDPEFQAVGGNQIHGSPLNEYGLLATYSYLGLANRAYVVRADVDLDQLVPSVIEPTSSKPTGTQWFDTSTTMFGLHVVTDASAPTWSPVDIDVILEGPTADNTAGVDGNYALFVNTTTSLIMYMIKLSGTWTQLGTTGPDDYQIGAVFPTTQKDGSSALSLGDHWVKNTSGTTGADYKINVLSATGQYVDQNAPVLLGDADADTFYGTPAIWDFYVDGTIGSGADFSIKYYDGTAWVISTIYITSDTIPVDGPEDGVYWFNPDVGIDGAGLSTVDVLIKDGGSAWQNVNLPGFTSVVAAGGETLYSQTTDPSLTIALTTGDLWVDSDQLSAYPVISRWSGLVWTVIDNSDQTTNNGIRFADARAMPDSSNSGVNNGAGTGPDLDFDVPDPDAYPQGFLLFNTRYSTMNVKQWDANHVGMNPAISTDDGRWVNASGNYEDGSPKMGTEAQRAVIVKALQSVLVSNDDIRSEFIFYNLIATPGFPETIDEMIALNIDRKETAFIIGDTPFSLNPSATALREWSANANNAATNGQLGLLSSDPYVGVYYPSGLGTNTDGSDVVVPPSHMMLRTMGHNDQVSFPWFAPAGLRRGRITNAASVGFIDGEGEYVPVSLSQGQRDTLYINNVNPIVNPGGGLVAFGQKTRNPFDSALSRINVARLINYIRFQSDQLARPFLFEPNDAQTRSNAKDSFDKFMAQLITLRGLNDFIVVCDESNNTPARIDQNEMWIDIAIVPIKSVEFIYIPIRIRNTGSL